MPCTEEAEFEALPKHANPWSSRRHGKARNVSAADRGARRLVDQNPVRRSITSAPLDDIWRSWSASKTGWHEGVEGTKTKKSSL